MKPTERIIGMVKIITGRLTMVWKVQQMITGYVSIRKQQIRNFLTTLFLSQGVPMLVAGDELGRTQHGNNNAYCQDNELNWINWDKKDDDLLTYGFQIDPFQA